MELQDLRSAKSEPLYFAIPEPKSPSALSKLLFGWIFPLLNRSRSVTLENEDTHPLPERERVLHENLSASLARHKVLSGLLFSNWRLLLFSIVVGNILVVLEFTGPVFMSLLLDYLRNPDRSYNDGLILAGTFTGLNLIFPIIANNLSFYNQLLSLRVRNSLFNTIYNKTLSSTNLPEGVGVNLLQVDTSKITNIFASNGVLFYTPLELALSILLIYSQVGNAVWIGVATMGTAMLVNFFLASTCKRLNEQVMEIRDTRMEKSTELLTEIKMIKAYSWEQTFMEKIRETREKELGKLRILNLLYSMNIFYYWTLPSLTAVTVLAYYTVVMDEELDSSKTFITLTTLLMLQTPLRSIPSLVSSVVQAWVSAKRIQELVDSKKWEALPNSGKISLENCSFGYGPTTVLHGITLHIEDREFLAIIGPVGCGKSSLLLGLLGEIPLLSGTLLVNTDVAYAPSLDSWLLSATLRDNILMGRDFREAFYWKVVEACCLLPDIKSLPAGDFTEIGERGINLSGGQKARICLARAVYADTQVILMDDPLSSVDNNVADHIFSKCFQKLLKHKTRVLVTHRHNYLDRVDRVLELREGKTHLLSQGIVSELTSFTKEVSVDWEEESPEKKEQVGGEETPRNKLVEVEDREVGEVTREVYLDYQRFSGSYVWVILAIISMVLWLITRMLGDIYLKDWSEHPTETSYYLPIYISLKLGGCIFIFTRSMFLTTILSIKSSYHVHEKLMKSLLRAPVNLFYDVTPLGRILNRLSKDLYTIDEDVAFGIGTALAQVCQTISCILMGMLYFPYLIIFLPLIFFPSRYVGRAYQRVSRELTRLESISRSPILNKFKETLSGAKFIRAFKQSDNFMEKNRDLIDVNTRLNYSLMACGAWMGMYLGLISAVLLSVFYWSAVLFGGSVPIGIVGLCLTYMIPLPKELSELIIDVTSMENRMVSVERVKSYMEIPSEQDLNTNYDLKHTDWPRIPLIRFTKVHMRYRPNTETVLKGLSFEIPAGNRVGITGRTGSGKSSVFLALLRLVELDSGVITIDGVNIALLGLKKLRECITLVPQDPLVFNGTMKENVDPLGRFSDAVAQKTLDDVNLKFSLDYPIKNSGQNISIGERQLLSLSRALICNTRILLFDETTAGIDPGMDSTIQNIIKEKFKECTILTIAHRLATIMNNDLILLLADGKVKEIGSPSQLLAYESDFKILSKGLH